ncbi:MAG: MoaD/ThiS family protein [Paludibacter sp.]|nr:MoaD/ThiS family protein [Paludibacter sp.]
MVVKVNFRTQVKAAAGVDSVKVELPVDSTFNDLMTEIQNKSIHNLNSILFDSESKVSRSLLFTINQSEQIRSEDNIGLNDGDIISIFSPISGG